jgi:CHASE2 domain-containing sensor protein
MKNSNDWVDLISILVGSIGSLLKALKMKMPKRSIILSMCIAGVVTYGAIGLLSMFFNDLSPKVLVLASFSIGWIANALTNKLDDFVNDVYDILIFKLKSIFHKK